MPARTYTLTLDGNVQSLAAGITETDRLRFISIQAQGDNSGIVYVGGKGSADTLSTSKYGWRIEIPVATIPAAPSIIEFSQNVMNLTDFEVLGTNNDVIHITAIF